MPKFGQHNPAETHEYVPGKPLFAQALAIMGVELEEPNPTRVDAVSPTGEYWDLVNKPAPHDNLVGDI